jgi:PKHD-type hydroxylase
MNWLLNPTKNEFWVTAPSFFTPEECDLIVSLGSELKLDLAKVHDGVVDPKIRKANCGFLDGNDTKVQWVYKRLTDLVNSVNQEFWNYDLKYIEPLQFTAYLNENDFYTAHTDDRIINYAIYRRKLSFVVQLSDPNHYEGSELEILSTNNIKLSKKRGDVVFFPSYVLHEVTPLVKGKRYSLVGWVCGPPFR